MMYIIFYKTNDVFAAEEKLLENKIETKIVPTPVQDKAYCGVCVQIHDDDIDFAEVVLTGMDYQLK